MNREQVREVVLKYVAAASEELDPAAIDTARSLREYGVNSLDMMEVVSRSMRELKVKVPRAELRKLTNIDGLIDLLHQAKQAARAVPAVAVEAETAPARG